MTDMLYRDPQMIQGEVRPKQPCYFVIQCAHVQRWSSKHTDARDAAKECFGMSTPNMKAWNLGTRVDIARKLARQIPPPPKSS